jgi:hypothetical protein
LVLFLAHLFDLRFSSTLTLCTFYSVFLQALYVVNDQMWTLNSSRTKKRPKRGEEPCVESGSGAEERAEASDGALIMDQEATEARPGAVRRERLRRGGASGSERRSAYNRPSSERSARGAVRRERLRRGGASASERRSAYKQDRRSA